MQVQHGFGLSEKEKQTLRLIVRGHDAKSIARALGLSVHTINERLRDARRKMAVSSSREAARLLLAAEGGAAAPDYLGDMGIGADAAGAGDDQGAGQAVRRPWIIGGLLMTFALGLLALSLSPQFAAAPPTAPAAERVAPDPAVVDAAQRFLVLLDQGRWDESYRATAASFRSMNTLQVWIDASEQARKPLGAMLSRSFLSQQNLPAPPHGYEVVKFRTRFANRADAVETVTLDREEGAWRVVGVMIE